VVGECDNDRRMSAFRHVLFLIICAAHNRSQLSSNGVTQFHLPPILMQHQDPAKCGTSRPPSHAHPAILSHSPQCPLLSHRSSMDYVSVLSTSPYAQSTLSSNFTLSADSSSASSASFDGKPRLETMGTVLSTQLKWLDCEISLLEAGVSHKDRDRTLDEPRVMLKGKEKKDDDTERNQWKRVLEDHKK